MIWIGIWYIVFICRFCEVSVHNAPVMRRFSVLTANVIHLSTLSINSLILSFESVLSSIESISCSNGKCWWSECVHNQRKPECRVRGWVFQYWPRGTKECFAWHIGQSCSHFYSWFARSIECIDNNRYAQVTNSNYKHLQHSWWNASNNGHKSITKYKQ